MERVIAAMRQPPATPLGAVTVPAPHTSDARLRGRWPVVARGLWLIVAPATLTIFFGSLPVFMAQLRIPCTPTICNYQQLTPGQIEAFNGIDISLDTYVAITTTILIASALVSLAVSTLIIWRKSDNRMAVLAALTLVTPVNAAGAAAVASATTIPNPWLVPNLVALTLGIAALVLVFLVFPTGHFVPRWMRWVALAYVVILILFQFSPQILLMPGISGSSLGWLVALGGFALAALVQFYRYWHVSTPVQRQQTKWVAFGFAVPILINVVGSLLDFIPALSENGALFPLFFNEMGFLLVFGVPLGFGVAILHSRLWDVDALINRTLVYGTLTVILASLYAGLVIGLQALLGGVVPQDNSVAIVVSTLLIAALFNPLRRTVQAFIDQRFYRRKYDAAKTLAAFSASLRSELDLAQLNEHLVTVVHETMQPAHVSLWLRDPDQPVAHRE